MFEREGQVKKAVFKHIQASDSGAEVKLLQHYWG